VPCCCAVAAAAPSHADAHKAFEPFLPNPALPPFVSYCRTTWSTCSRTLASTSPTPSSWPTQRACSNTWWVARCCVTFLQADAGMDRCAAAALSSVLAPAQPMPCQPSMHIPVQHLVFCSPTPLSVSHSLQGAKLQYGHVPLYESGDNPNAKQFQSLHAVQVRAACSPLVCLCGLQPECSSHMSSCLKPSTDLAVVLQLSFTCSATWWTPTAARWHMMTMRRSMRWVLLQCCAAFQVLPWMLCGVPRTAWVVWQGRPLCMQAARCYTLSAGVTVPHHRPHLVAALQQVARTAR